MAWFALARVHFSSATARNAGNPIKNPKSKANIKFEMPSSQLSVSQNPDVFEFWSLNIWDLGCEIWNSQRSQSHPLNSLQAIDR